MSTENEYQPPAQFSRTTSIPTSTLSKMRMRGGGPPFVKIGRAVRYPVRAGLEWMTGQTHHSTSELSQTKRARRHRGRTAAVVSAASE